jgi:hypothetical protein
LGVIAALRKILAARAELGRLQALADAGFTSDPPKLSHILKHNNTSIVSEGHWQGRHVIVKRLLSCDPEADIARVVREHQRLGALFPHENLHFAGCIGHAPAQGLIILPFMSGEQVDHVLRNARPDLTRHVMTSASAWLARSIEGTRTIGQFSPEYWIRTLQAEAEPIPLSDSDAALIQSVLTHLQKMAPALRGGPVPRAAIHGDYSSQNLFWDSAKGHLNVFDVQFEQLAPMAVDIARLLTHLSVQRLQDNPHLPLDRGLCAELRAIMMSHPELDHPDPPGGFLDFLTGYRMAAYLLTKIEHISGHYTRQTLRHWLETVPCP